MRRADLIAALPCYICGDLPPALAEAVRREVEADPELVELAASLRAGSLRCQEALGRAAPALVRLEQARQRPRAQVSALWPLALGLGVLLALAGVTRDLGPSPSEQAAALLSARVGADPRALDGYVEGEAALALTGGAGGALSRLPAGWRVAGGAPRPEGGLVLALEGGGEALALVMAPDQALPVAGARVIPGAPPGAPTLRRFTWEGREVVAWRADGLLCLAVGAGEAPERVARALTW